MFPRVKALLSLLLSSLNLSADPETIRKRLLELLASGDVIAKLTPTPIDDMVIKVLTAGINSDIVWPFLAEILKRMSLAKATEGAPAAAAVASSPLADFSDADLEAAVAQQLDTLAASVTA